MTFRPDRKRIEAELDLLGIENTRGTRQLIGLLATEPHLLYGALSRLSELHEPADDAVPPVDRLVAEYFETHFEHCTEPSVLRKTKPISAQCRRLLGVLMRDLGTPVPLAELLLANGLRSATPRRLRELETEHGAFRIRTYNKDRVQYYSLESPEPNIPECAQYWIKANLRDSKLRPAPRVLALLSAFIGKEVTRRELDYLLPEEESAGRGLARASAGQTNKALAELRGRGYAIEETPSGILLRSVPAESR
jgi:hypothetical protein